MLSKYPLVHVRSYAQMRDTEGSGRELFSRDCLEVDVDVEGTIFTIYVNHLKSMIRTREETRPKRERQAAGVKKIIEDRFGPKPGDENFIVVGDLNDCLESDDEGIGGQGAGRVGSGRECGRAAAGRRPVTHFFANRGALRRRRRGRTEGIGPLPRGDGDQASLTKG
ncbi:MAG TPA: hypothetical protein VF081_13850 [Solirubrobacterales bacterium]